MPYPSPALHSLPPFLCFLPGDAKHCSCHNFTITLWHYIIILSTFSHSFVILIRFLSVHLISLHFFSNSVFTTFRLPSLPYFFCIPLSTCPNLPFPSSSIPSPYPSEIPITPCHLSPLSHTHHSITRYFFACVQHISPHLCSSHFAHLLTSSLMPCGFL